MLSLRSITPDDNAAVARIIRTVMPEFNCVGEGFSINDPELRDMYLETVRAMTAAAQVYARYGFTYLDGPMGATGHSGCDRFMLKSFR